VKWYRFYSAHLCIQNEICKLERKAFGSDMEFSGSTHYYSPANSPTSWGPMLRACSEVEVTNFWVTVKVTAAGQGERVVTPVPLPATGKPTDHNLPGYRPLNFASQASASACGPGDYHVASMNWRRKRCCPFCLSDIWMDWTTAFVLYRVHFFSFLLNRNNGLDADSWSKILSSQL
jgi:hypothetical protein